MKDKKSKLDIQTMTKLTFNAGLDVMMFSVVVQLVVVVLIVAALMLWLG